MQFTFTNGLVLRDGQRSIELIRELSAEELQFEDMLTRRALMIKKPEVLKRIWSGRYQVMLGGVSLKTTRNGEQDQKGLSETLVDSIPESWREQIDRRFEYVKALQAAHVTRGQRQRIAGIAMDVALRRKEKVPPSASAIMRWARCYQQSVMVELVRLD